MPQTFTDKFSYFLISSNIIALIVQSIDLSIALIFQNFLVVYNFYNINFRGIAAIKIKEKFQIDETDIDIINRYDYLECFNDYINKLQLVSLN